MLKLLTLFDLVRPLLDAIAILFWSVAAALLFWSVSYRKNAPLLMLAFACLVSVFGAFIWLLTDLHLHWHITLLPVAVRRVAYITSQLIYVFDIFFFPTVYTLLALQNRKSSPSTPQ
jgi:hypothetical protein